MPREDVEKVFGVVGWVRNTDAELMASQERYCTSRVSGKGEGKGERKII
jgi:hypothetical protein